MHGAPITGWLDLVLLYPAQALGLDHSRLSSLKHLNGMLASIVYCYILFALMVFIFIAYSLF